MAVEKLIIASEILLGNKDIVSNVDDEFIASGNFTALKSLCDKYGITTELKGTHSLIIRFDLFIPKNLVYFDPDIFDIDPTFTQAEFSILTINGDYCYHPENTDSLLFNDKAPASFILRCQNLYNYYVLFNFLKSEGFSDHFNELNKEIVIYSSARGIFKIKYSPLPVLDFSNAIAQSVHDLIAIASPMEIRPFFKNALYAFSTVAGIIPINDIINKAQDIIQITKRDFEIVSRQFDFDKFRDTLYKEKEKYFTNIREIINKIFGQAVGIPISISASVFATYKVEGDAFMLGLILLAFILYTILYIKIQLTYRADICELRDDFIRDFEIIRTKSGLPPDLIKTERDKIEGKISSSIDMIDLMNITIAFLVLLVCLYIFYEIGQSKILSILAYIVQLLFR